MSTIPLLFGGERLCLDPERLASLYLEMGERTAQQLLEQATLEMDTAIEAAVGQLRRKDLFVLRDHVSRVERLAELMGLVSVAHVAADVCDLCEADDPTALAATMARLQRAVNRSLKIVWTLGDKLG